MPQPSLLTLLGSKGQKEARYAPIFTDRFFVGYWSNRNPLRSPLSTLYADGWRLGGTDALIDGLNTELSPRLTICRRPGTLAYSTATVPTPPLTFYPFRLFSTNTIDMIVDTATTVYTLTPTALNSIFSKSAAAGEANFLGIGQTLYFGDGVEAKAWQSSTIRNWGINSGGVSAASGSSYAGGFFGSGGWTNPSNAEGAPDGVFASIAWSGAVGTAPLVLNAYSPYSPVISPTSTIQGITITVSYKLTGNQPAQLYVSLFYQGALLGTNKFQNIPLTTEVTATFGSSTDTWGAMLTPAIVNDPTFGVYIQGNSTSSSLSDTLFIDAAQITVNSSGGGPAISKVGTGTFSATTGYQYVVAYGNSGSGAVSSASPASGSSGPFTNINYIGIPVIASTDPQVNQIWVFRTADGGSTFLNLPTSPYPNTSTTIQDNSPDSQLNILQQAPLNLVNNPPPASALDPVYYLGLVWVHSGNNVYFTRTASAIVGNTNEAFPPANVFSFPEQVIRKIPISSGLLIQTTSNIYIILGNNTSSSTLFSTSFLAGYGILSWNALCTQGSIIYFFTSDNRAIELNPSSGVTDLGFPIADKLAAVNPATVYLTYNSTTSNDVALYLGDGSTGWFRCNPYQAPDQSITGPVWSPKATIIGGCQALVGMETSPGIHQLMLGGTGSNSTVLVRDSSYTTFTDNGTAYHAYATIGSIVLAQPGQVAICRFVTCDFIRTGTSPIVSVLMGEVSGSFESISGYVVPDPPYLQPSTSLFNNRYYFKQTVAGGNPSPVVCRHLQIKVDYGTDTVQNEILSFTINGAIANER